MIKIKHAKVAAVNSQSATIALSSFQFFVVTTLLFRFDAWRSWFHVIPERICSVGPVTVGAKPPEKRNFFFKAFDTQLAGVAQSSVLCASFFRRVGVSSMKNFNTIVSALLATRTKVFDEKLFAKKSD
jgi:hypothetical protein